MYIITVFFGSVKALFAGVDDVFPCVKWLTANKVHKTAGGGGLYPIQSIHTTIIINVVVKNLRIKDEDKNEDLKIGPRGLSSRTTTL